MPVNRLELLRKSPADLVTYKMVMMDLKILASYYICAIVFGELPVSGTVFWTGRRVCW